MTVVADRILWLLHHVIVHPLCGLAHCLVDESRANRFHDMLTPNPLLVEHANHADVERDFRNHITVERAAHAETYAALAKAEDRIKELEKEIVLFRQSF